MRASKNLQTHLNLLQQWFQQWRIKINNDKSVQIIFTTRRTSCPQVKINNSIIPTKTEVEYLGLHLDQKLTWKTHIRMKRQQLGLKVRQMNWLIGNRSQLSLENKVLLYKAILKPIWTYDIELWGCAKPSNTKILQSFQSKPLRNVTGAPWCISNKTLHEDLNIPFITDVIKQRANRYRSRLSGHVNQLIADLSKPHAKERRLKKRWPEDLIN
jgi:hypothetical protein